MLWMAKKSASSKAHIGSVAVPIHIECKQMENGTPWMLVLTASLLICTCPETWSNCWVSKLPATNRVALLRQRSFRLLSPSTTQHLWDELLIKMACQQAMLQQFGACWIRSWLLADSSFWVPTSQIYKHFILAKCVLSSALNLSLRKWSCSTCPERHFWGCHRCERLRRTAPWRWQNAWNLTCPQSSSPQAHSALAKAWQRLTRSTRTRGGTTTSTWQLVNGQPMPLSRYRPYAFSCPWVA